MAMKSRSLSSVVMFDVLYEDGTRNSNRKVPGTALSGLDGDAPARSIIEAQDREISAVSGRPRGVVKSVVRSPVKPPDSQTGPDRKAARGAKR